jgi:hypothetical protein
VLEASALSAGDAQCNACRDTILGGRQMPYATNEWPRDEVDAYIGDACRPILGQFMEVAAWATGGMQFEPARDGDHEQTWFEFEHFCANADAPP